MRLVQMLMLCLVVGTTQAFDLDETIDQLDNALTFSAPAADLNARVSGTLDVEYYHFDQPPPGLIYTDSHHVFNPRLTLFLDAQWKKQIYFFAQSRLDRGFDPSDHGAQIRMDEYAVRFTPWSDGRFNFQIAKFATVVGNWVPRHLSWENPFINAPLPYENITPISDKTAPSSPKDFVRGFDPSEKDQYNPMIWGPNYASGISVFGRLEQFDYAVEMKNAPLASRPETWNIAANGFDPPSFNGRFGFRPSEMWNFGVSGGEGPYMRSEAQLTLPARRDVDDYRQFLIGQDASFAWHHLQIWAECYEARFEVPRVGDADMLAYYLETKYKFTPQLFGALRWNQEFFGAVNKGTATGDSFRWDQNLGRFDVAAGYRFTSHTQLKLQYSFQQQTTGPRDANHLFAAQFTLRF